jgi:hypothetical protein
MTHQIAPSIGSPSIGRIMALYSVAAPPPGMGVGRVSRAGIGSRGADVLAGVSPEHA